MKPTLLIRLAWLVCLLSATCEAATVEQLNRQLQELRDSFERVQQQQRMQIEALQRQIESLQVGTPANLNPTGTKTTATATATHPEFKPKPGTVDRPGASQKQLEEDLAVELAASANSSTNANPTSATAVTSGPPWRPSDPIRIGSAGSFLDIGLVGTFAAGGSTAHDIAPLEPGGHDPNQRGFSVQGVEASFSGAVDPYFRAAANIAYTLDAAGESAIELEEAWLETTSLPWNLQLRAGQLLTEFGRVNTQHPHGWSFIDAPLVSTRFLGADGLRNPGVRLSWLAPLPFFSELALSVQDSQGGTAASFRSGAALDQAPAGSAPFAYRHASNDRGVGAASDLLFTPRWSSSFDLTDSQTLLAGVSAALGPNASGDSGDPRTEILGMDLTWKWMSSHHHGGFPFVQVQTEGMLRRYEAAAFDWAVVPADESRVTTGDGVTPAQLGPETLVDYGLYGQVTWGFTKGWVAGFRGDYLAGDTADYEQGGLFWRTAGGSLVPLGRDLNRLERWRLSPNLTWYPSEFSKIRVQYNYDDRQFIGIDHSVWLQFEFLIGAHAAHKF